LSRLPEIKLAQEAAERVLDEVADPVSPTLVDLSNPELTERYFRYYFFDRRLEMVYPIGAERNGRSDSLLNMLSENGQAVTEARRQKSPSQSHLKHSFMTAARAFEPIDAQTRGVIVPYGPGRALIADLCAAFDLEKSFKLLKLAQQFTVNVFPYVLNRLEQSHAVTEVQPGSGVLFLGERFYSKESGLSLDGLEEMEFENA
jgi:CRISPR-associated endonuclease/helicase Cas3